MAEGPQGQSTANEATGRPTGSEGPATPAPPDSGGGMDSLFERIATEMSSESRVAAAGVSPSDLSASGVDGSPPGGVVLDGTGSWPAPDISTQIDRPRIANRQCSRSGCSDVAAVTLSYHYETSQVWIDHLAPERDPHRYDLCSHHAGRMSVPRGWHLEDRRRVRRGALIAV
ncbi:DUF3499 family protein [Ilumatobacter sp.]|uniref:DUF3499 family protein n=1 Tax=Ilumatobacter sp. TaxID=1967498 RepID=UPI003B52351A